MISLHVTLGITSLRLEGKVSFTLTLTSNLDANLCAESSS
jgi:hypothetical protein